jgi:hypothetical protein
LENFPCCFRAIEWLSPTEICPAGFQFFPRAKNRASLIVQLHGVFIVAQAFWNKEGNFIRMTFVNVRKIAALFVVAFLSCVSLHAATVSLKINATEPGISGAVCVRAIIQKSDGSFVSGEWDNDSYPVTMRGKAFGPDTVVDIPAGQTIITIGKGPDIFPQTITNNFDTPGKVYTVNVSLQPVFDLYRKGWRGGDGHVHYNHGENQIARTPDEAFTMLAAGGMNWASFAEEHYGAVTMTRQQMQDVWKKYDGSECKLWNGVEEPKNAWGHHIAIVNDPWAIRSAMPYHLGAREIHDQGGVIYPVHPQRFFPGRFYDNPDTGQRDWALYPNSNHLKSFPMDALLGYLDGWSGLSDQGNNDSMLEPYFKLLALGYRIPFLADSDCTMDRVNNGIKSPGCWMSYYQIGGTASRSSIADAMRKGKVMSTTGPLVLFTIDGAMSGDTLSPNGSSRTVRIQASHTFNPWTMQNSTFAGDDICKIAQIDLFRNGQVIQSWNPNTPTADLRYTINESSPNSYYMVRVIGNENQWMAAYASPIYFDNSARARQPDVYKSLINGRLYDASNGNRQSGSVSCVRYGKTEWTIQTDSQGLFRAYVPLDAQLVAKDSSGRQFIQEIMKYEPAYAFCHNLGDNFPGRMGESVDAYKNIVREMNWEFPMGYQSAASYVKTSLSDNAAMSDFTINSVPPATSGKQITEIVMLIVDKTQVRAGDTINFAVLFRQPQGQTPSEELSVVWTGWDPDHPRMYTRYGTAFQFNNSPADLKNLGNGFYLRQGSVVVPSWVENSTDTTAAIRLFASVRNDSASEEAMLLLPLGPTKKELFVSTTWDGFPASWGEIGIGPCNFHRELTANVRYSDYREISFEMKLNGDSITISPKADTAHVADADDAFFTENFYYDAQCEPQFRNISFRDSVRGQPLPPNFDSVQIQDPSGSGGGGGGGGGSGTAPLTIQINGGGTVSPDLNGKNLLINRSYKISAKPQAGQIFSSWGGDVVSSNATLNFSMQSNLVLQANFFPNPFASAEGNYAGLFFESGGAQHASSGFFTLNVTDKGSFSSRFIVGGKKTSDRGQFDSSGNAPLQLAIAGKQISGDLHLDFANQVTGTVTDGNWISHLIGKKSRTNSDSAEEQYTIVIPGNDSGTSPAGDGFGSAIVNSSGAIRFSGVLADGTKISQSVNLSSDSTWPLYVSIYRGQGSLLGWVNLGSDVNGAVNWSCPSIPKRKFYPVGFSNVINVAGSPYNPAANPIVNFQNGILSFGGGNLESFEQAVQLESGIHIIAANDESGRVSVKLKNSTGILNGRFTNPSNGKTTKFSGVLLQNQNSGSGFFLGTNEVGSMRLRSND